MLGARALLDASATTSMFVESTPASRLTHVHAHVHWNEAESMPSCIVCINFSNSDCAGAAEQLTARVVFSMCFIRACSEYDPKDAVMGFVPALMHSGASFDDFLRKIPGTPGARFTEAFYQ